MRKPTMSTGASAIALTLMFAAHAPAALAQATIPSDSGAATAEEAPADTGTGEILVTAQRRSESIQKVPVSIQAFSGAQLTERGVGQVQDIQKVATNVTISSPLGEGSAPAINIRGIGLNDFNTNNSGPNGVYVDEFAITSPNAQGLSFFDIQRVEILKGPQGTLYGRNASGGAINITTAAPTREFSGYARAAYSSFRTVDLEGAISGPLSDTLSARVSGTFKKSDGFMYNHLYNRHENGVHMWGVRGQLKWEPSSDFDATLKVQFVGNDTRAPMYKFYGVLDPNNPDPTDRSTWCSIANVYANNNCVDFVGYAGRKGYYEGDWNNGNDKVRLRDRNATLRMQYQLGGGFKLVSVTGYNSNSRFHPEQTDANPLRVLEINYTAHAKEFTQELRLSQEADKYNWVLGGYFIDERIKQDQPLSVFLDGDTIFGAPGALDGVAYVQQTRNAQKLTSEAIFAQGEYKLTPVLSLLAGARYTWEKRSFNAYGGVQYQLGGQDHFGPLQDETNVSLRDTAHNFSWKLGAKAQLDPDTMLFATVSTGYKGGGFNGGFLSSDPAQRALQLQPFKPETVTAYEAGFKKQLFGRAVTVNGSVFLSDYKNQQVSTLTQVPDATQPTGTRILFLLTNAKKARIKGIDADVSWHVTSNLTLGAQLGYLDAKFTDFNSVAGNYTGNRLSLAPKLTTTLSAGYTRDLGPVTLKLDYDATYRSKVFFEPTNDPYLFQKGYWLHNARIGVTLNDSQVTISAFARNFTRTKYSIWTAGLFDPFGVVANTAGPPRSFGGEVSFKF